MVSRVHGTSAVMLSDRILCIRNSAWCCRVNLLASVSVLWNAEDPRSRRNIIIVEETIFINYCTFSISPHDGAGVPLPLQL